MLKEKEVRRNYLAEPFEAIEQKIKRATEKKLGKTDCCILGMVLDKYSLINYRLVDELIDGMIECKSKVVNGFKDCGQIMLDMLYQMFYLIKVKKQHISMALTSIKTDLETSIKTNKMPFPRVELHRDEQKLLHNAVVQVIKLSQKVIPDSSSFHYDLFIQSYWFGTKLSHPQAFGVLEKLADSLSKLPKSGGQELAYQKYQLTQNYELIFLNEWTQQQAKYSSQQQPPQKKEIPQRYPSSKAININVEPISHRALVEKKNKENDHRINIVQNPEFKFDNQKVIPNQITIDKPQQVFPVQQLPTKHSEGTPFIEQPFFSQEIQDVLMKIGEISDFERSHLMKLYGRFDTVQKGLPNTEEIKKRYPQIHYLSKASTCLEQVMNVKPRGVQIISCLLFLFKEKAKGRILQINTGEGKSITVALMAATRSLMGDKVDVYTSNKELAKRDCEEFEKFYKELGLTAGSIGSEELRSSEPNEIYKRNIVYGDVGSYAADLLGDEYEQRGTRCGRTFEFAIVDEVDCMFIDQHNHSTSLAKSIPGLSKLNLILWFIWYKITQMRDNFLNGFYFLRKDLVKQDQENNQIFSQEENSANYVNCRADEYIFEYINSLLLEGDVSMEIDKNIPNHLKSFALSQVKEWIRNGFYAHDLQRNKEYKVESDKIIPIDYDNTGLAQANTQWRGGLHQFIQMKENVTVTPMNMTVNFVSNIYMFLLYKSNLVGLTGTLGTSKSIHILQDFYSIDALKVPTFKPRKLQIIPPLILESTTSFSFSLITELTKKYKEGRPCLIICESEKFGMHLSKFLSFSFPQVKLIEYYSGDETIEKESLDEFRIILSTNLAGRGTDIKLSSSVVQKGGLHVIVTFTPKNKRVEDQAFGRAGRCGQEGSAQMIIDAEKDSFVVKNKIVGNLLEERDKVDNDVCDRQLQNMHEISKMDKIFWDYCSMLNKCEELKEKTYMRKQEEEIWATFYCKIQFMRKEPEKVKSEYEEFKEEFRRRVLESKIVNPTYLINESVKLLMGEKFDSAIQMIDSILEKNSDNFSACYVKAIALAMLKKHQKAVSLLEKCERLLQQTNSMHQALQIISLQSQSLVQQEYSQELLQQSRLLNKNLRYQVEQSQIFEDNKEGKYSREQLEKHIEESGCFKRIKDQQVIRGKLLEHIRDMKQDIIVLHRNPYIRQKLSFVPIPDYFKDDKIGELVLKEHQNEDMAFVIEFKESNPLQWKSLIPLACALFQLANALYLLQDGHNRTASEREIQPKINSDTLIVVQPNNLTSSFVVQSQVKGVRGIADAIKQILQVEELDLKDHMSVQALRIVEAVRKWEISKHSKILNIMSEQSGNKVQTELIQRLQMKDQLVHEILRDSPDIAFVAQQMTTDENFKMIAKLSLNFQQNCHTILEKQCFDKLFSNSVSKLEKLQRNFKHILPYLSFSSFQKDISETLVNHVSKQQKKAIIDNLEEFVNFNYKNSLNSNDFLDIVTNAIQQPIAESINQASKDLQTIVIESVRDQVLSQLKATIKKLKDSIKDTLVPHSNNPHPGYIQQKQGQYLDKKLRDHQKFYAFIKSDNVLLPQFPNYVILSLQVLKMIDSTGQLSANINPAIIKGEIKFQALRANPKQTEFEEFIEMISNTFIASFEKDKNCSSQASAFKEFQQMFFKRVAEKILNPVLKNVQHVFHHQIESNAIYGLFKHIIA